jgi:multisubunit Na+/H+ antiporter MnhG subunit
LITITMTTTKKKLFHTFTLIVGLALSTVNSLSVSRRKAVLAIPSAFLAPVIAHAEAELPDRFDVE